MLLRSEIPPEVNWSQASKYQSVVKRGRVGAPVITFREECAASNLNWALVYLWCQLRTNWSQGVGVDWDVGKLGAKYQTSREGVRAAVVHLAAFERTEQLAEGEALVAEYEALCRYAKGENPKAEDPIVSPPAPPPPPVVEPEPTKTIPIPGGANTKSSFKAILSVAAGIATLLGIASIFVPALAPIAAILKSAIAALQAIFVGV
jgi:hypothetical protein